MNGINNKTQWVRFIIKEVYGTNGSGEEEQGTNGYFVELNKFQLFSNGNELDLSTATISTYSLSAGGFNTLTPYTTNVSNILGNTVTNWVFNATGLINSSNPVYVTFQFPEKIVFDSYVLTTGSDVYSAYNDARNPISWELQISRDGKIWEYVDAKTSYTDIYYPSNLVSLGLSARSYRLPQTGYFSTIQVYFRDVLSNYCNGILSFEDAMPFKDTTSDGTNTFSMGRHQYVNTITAINAPQAKNYQQKKWIGWRDASQVTQTHRISAVGSGSMNSDGKEMSFKNVLDHNTARNARQRVRSAGATAPLKKGKSTNFM